MEKVVLSLGTDLEKWSKNTQAIAAGDLVPLARLDQSCRLANLDGLYFESTRPESLSCSGLDEIRLLRRQMVSTGRLRNSFFPEIFRRHTKFEKLCLTLDMTGSLTCDIYQCVLGTEPVCIQSALLPQVNGELVEPNERHQAQITLDMEEDLAKDARLFWDVTALNDDVVLNDIAWQAVAPTAARGRMVVVLRTFGRTRDIHSLLSSFESQAKESAHYQRMLKNLFFVVLDTSNDLRQSDYADLATFEHVTAHVIKGANLGGGGNMSQILLYLEQALQATGVEVDELLLLDDDLRLSLESMLRHWASVVLRSDNTVFTLPVFMKSLPRRMWEDGAIWGRFLDERMSSARTAIAPRLLRHNREFVKFEYLDEMAKPHYPEYCTFIFFSLPHARFQQLGYPAAFFLRGDDIEYSLRHGAANGRTLSNPNLCAWHEPAHSYGQEYMSIAHGTIINMRYGAEKSDSLVQFFYDRMVAHSTINDALGLQLYAHVLRDLNDKTMFLNHEFAGRYMEKLGAFKALDQRYGYLPAELRDGLRDNARETNTRLGEYGFLYPHVAHDHRPERVILENPHTESFYVYDTKDPEVITACAAATADLARELDRFARSYDDVRNHYLERFEEVSDPAFWQAEIALTPPPETVLCRVNV